MIFLKEKGSGNNGYVSFHGGDMYWYHGTEIQAYCFRDKEDAQHKRPNLNLDDYDIIERPAARRTQVAAFKP